jgi:hypothetical protein
MRGQSEGRRRFGLKKVGLFEEIKLKNPVVFFATIARS